MCFAADLPLPQSVAFSRRGLSDGDISCMGKARQDHEANDPLPLYCTPLQPPSLALLIVLGVPMRVCNGNGVRTVGGGCVHSHGHSSCIAFLDHKRTLMICVVHFLIICSNRA